MSLHSHEPFVETRENPNRHKTYWLTKQIRPFLSYVLSSGVLEMFSLAL